MRHYHIYLLGENIASHYCGRELKLYQLFLERELAATSKRSIFDRQIQYISRPIPTLLIQQKLKSLIKGKQEFIEQENSYYVHVDKPKSEAILDIHANYLRIKATGGPEAETVFFEVLRRLDPCYFAVDTNHEHYGWLNPIRQEQYMNKHYWC
ncbi:sporulation inhibitor of replication protein SirA [Alkalihalobacillus pseudalcaliphilus]|uniref:sporulation inhibitor of replication protein SirA n=1 Tax=Alkalihalobacillus pseudalcaliphilus TaxID=79884 RepID=UPI00064D8E5E|nr:sporulation inhibitor of replication protein SirA [Alkalihalobacillus pseudalcaliphilus]KMK76591.1 hypothetical protein AB990_15610 [Alkalihalobacillus pseudalcaliphilus]